jgi:serine protease
MVIASGVIGRHPSPAAIEQRLMATARDLGAPGYDTRYGAGLLDIGRATSSG